MNVARYTSLLVIHCFLASFEFISLVTLTTCLRRIVGYSINLISISHDTRSIHKHMILVHHPTFQTQQFTTAMPNDKLKQVDQMTNTTGNPHSNKSFKISQIQRPMNTLKTKKKGSKSGKPTVAQFQSYIRFPSVPHATASHLQSTQPLN